MGMCFEKGTNEKEAGTPIQSQIHRGVWQDSSDTANENI